MLLFGTFVLLFGMLCTLTYFWNWSIPVFECIYILSFSSFVYFAKLWSFLNTSYCTDFLVCYTMLNFCLTFEGTLVFAYISSYSVISWLPHWALHVVWPYQALGYHEFTIFKKVLLLKNLNENLMVSLFSPVNAHYIHICMHTYICILIYHV